MSRKLVICYHVNGSLALYIPIMNKKFTDKCKFSNTDIPYILPCILSKYYKILHFNFIIQF